MKHEQELVTEDGQQFINREINAKGKTVTISKLKAKKAMTQLKNDKTVRRFRICAKLIEKPCLLIMIFNRCMILDEQLE